MTSRLCMKCAEGYYVILNGKVMSVLSAWADLPKTTSRCLICGQQATEDHLSVEVEDYFHFESENAKKHQVYGLLPSLYGKSPQEITAYYRQLVSEARHKIEKTGLEVVYADTDSVWVIVAKRRTRGG